MTADKASTLKLLREGIGNPIRVLESRGDESAHFVRALLPECNPRSLIPVLFLISSLAFLEATPAVMAESEATESDDEENEFNEVDGWTPADFLSNLRIDGGTLSLSLGRIRGRAIHTELSLTQSGQLSIGTKGRGLSANRWIGFVEGRRHLQSVAATELNG